MCKASKSFMIEVAYKLTKKSHVGNWISPNFITHFDKKFRDSEFNTGTLKAI